MKLNAAVFLALATLPASMAAAIPRTAPEAGNGAVARGAGSNDEFSLESRGSGSKSTSEQPKQWDQRIHNGKKQYWSAGRGEWMNHYNNTTGDNLLVATADVFDKHGGKEVLKKAGEKVVKGILGE